jgi:hypothetical protein
MNGKGQTLMLSVIFALMIFFAGALFMNFLKDNIDMARGVNGANCGAVGMSDGSKVTCLVVDLVLPYAVLIVLSAAGGIMMERLLI